VYVLDHYFTSKSFVAILEASGTVYCELCTLHCALCVHRSAKEDKSVTGNISQHKISLC
jgi:hypothetical protein